MKKSVSHREFLLKALKDPIECIAYLNAAIEAGDRPAFLLALRNVIDAQTQMTTVAKKARIHRVSLHKMLSHKGNPEAESLIALFRVLGIRLVYDRSHAKEWKKAA